MFPTCIARSQIPPFPPLKRGLKPRRRMECMQRQAEQHASPHYKGEKFYGYHAVTMILYSNCCIVCNRSVLVNAVPGKTLGELGNEFAIDSGLNDGGIGWNHPEGLSVQTEIAIPQQLLRQHTMRARARRFPASTLIRWNPAGVLRILCQKCITFTTSERNSK